MKEERNFIEDLLKSIEEKIKNDKTKRISIEEEEDGTIEINCNIKNTSTILGIIEKAKFSILQDMSKPE